MGTVDPSLLTTELVATTSFETGAFEDSAGESDAFLRAAAHISGVPLPPPDARADHVIAGRYRLEARLGRGGYGEVWRAHDRLSGSSVAVKLLREGSAEVAARACREVAALRLLRLPGVVRLVDEGVEDGHPFMVMEHVLGTPFPGVPVPCAWSDLKGPLVRLLHALGRVHAAGFVHRDLKPENVLVDARGQPVVLDFGIARPSSGFARITEAGTVIGTPAYLAPEQLSDEPLTAQTDLYAVGVMVFWALSGQLPHPASSFAQLLRARLFSDAPPLSSVAPDVPAHVGVAVDWLLVIHPRDRPRSASEAIALFDDAPELPSRPVPRSGTGVETSSLDRDDGEPFGEDELREWFSGPDRVLHLREDAARILFERTNGIPSRVRRELDAWAAAGLVRWDGDRPAIPRAAIEQLRLDGPAFLADDDWSADRITAAHRDAAARLPAGAPGRLRHLLTLAGAAPAEEVAAEALASAGRLVEEGALGEATAHLEEGLFAARREGGGFPGALPALLAALVEVAFAEGGPQALDRALYELRRPGPTSPLAEQLTRLVRAALAVDAWTERASQLAEAVPPFDDVRLERLRQGVRVMAARRISAAREASVLEEVGAWAEASGDARAQASHAHWLGRLRYFENRFEEAARLQDEAAALCDWRPLRTAVLFHAGASWMETFDLDAAAARAEESRRLAEMSRHTFSELQAQQLSRTIAYRAAKTDGRAPDLELCEIAPLLGSAFWEGAVHITEAAVAYRNRDLPVARELAGRALRACGEAGHPVATVLAHSLLSAAGGPVSEGGIQSLVERARDCPAPAVGLQALALFAEGGARVETTDAALHVMAQTVPRAHWDRRLDVLSVAEALERLNQGHAGGGPDASAST